MDCEHAINSGGNVNNIVPAEDIEKRTINLTPCGIAVVEVDPSDIPNSLHTTYYNDEFFSYSGYDRDVYDALLRKNELHFVFDEDAPALIDATKKICASVDGEVVDCTVRCHIKDGGYRWLSLMGRLASKRGNICVINIAIMDMTKRMLAEDRLRISEEILRIAAETDKRALVTYDIKADMCRVESRNLYSAAFGETIYHLPKSLIERGIVSPKSVDAIEDLFRRIKTGEHNVSSLVYLRTSENEYQWFECNASTVSDSDGSPDQAVLVFHNITEQRVKEAVFRKWQNSIKARPIESYTLYRMSLGADSRVFEQEGLLLKIKTDNDACPFEKRASDYAEKYVFSDDRQEYMALLNSNALTAAYYRGEHMRTLEYREINSDSEALWRRLTVETVEYIGSGDIQAFLLYEDIDDIKKAQIRDRELANTDPLTGALNRTAFSKQVDILLENEADSQHALLMLDIDGFKLLNDKFGHAAGDQALQDITSVMRSLLRDGDIVCRLGGDEFLMWLRNVPYDAVIEKIAQQICSRVINTFSREVQISASVGISVYPRDGRDFDELYKNADKALYRVKQSGKNGFTLFSATDGAPSDSPTKIVWGRDTGTDKRYPTMRRMLIMDSSDDGRNELKAFFRDEYRLETARNGNEALIRLRHFGSAISVVLLDLDMDGFEVLKRMQNNVEMRTIPVIAVSSTDEHALLLKAIELGASDYVTKPIDNDLIHMRVSSAICKAENERLRAQNSYLQLQRDEDIKYHTVLESTGTVVIEYDWRNHVFTYDKMISNYIAGNFDHRGLWQVLLSDMVAESDDVKALQETMFSLAPNRGETSASRLLKLKTPNNARHWFRANIYKHEDFYGLAVKMIITFNDVHEEVLSNEKLNFKATHDELTGLYNREGFIQKAAEMIARKEAGYYVLACADIEKFKVINDQYGSDVGDRVLRDFANTITSVFNTDDSICCRVMADDFAALYPKRLLDTNDLDNLYNHMTYCDGTLPQLKLCIGRIHVDDKTLDVSALYDRAVMAKETVKGRYDAYIATYDESLRTSLLRRQYITSQMNNALQSGQFEVWLQPQFNHSTGRLIGCEALARWRHPVEGIISPNEFIPIFEQNGFVYELDKFVWEETCKLLRGWIDKGLRPVPVSVNVSRCDAFKSDLKDVIGGLVDKYMLPCDLLRLEITESAFTESNTIIINVVKDLVALGFMVEIDDFGSGYSSLNTLKDVPAQVLKMDMRFLENDENAQRGGSIIESVVRMARWLGMSVIAEGVETLEQADYLKSIGCELVQGYLYSRPTRVLDYESMFASGFIDSEPRKPLTLDTWNNNAFWNPSSIETLIFNSYVGGACIFEYRNGKTELLRYNDGYAEVFGYGAVHEQMENRLDILNSLDIENALLIKNNIDNAIATGKESTCECCLDKSSSSCLYAQITVRMIARAGDRCLLYCIVYDITSQRLAERGEREAASRMAVIMDNMASGITAVCHVDGTPRIIFSNDRYYAHLGYTREQFNAEVGTYFKAIHPSDRNAVWANVHETLQSGEPRSMEYRCIKRDGDIIYIRSNIAMCRLDSVEGDVIITVETDITELVKANEHISRTSGRLKAVMDNTTCGITAIIWRETGEAEYLFVNNRYFELLGYTREQYMSESPMGLELIHPEDLRVFEKQILSLKTVGQTMSFEFRARRRDGRWIWLKDDVTVISLDGTQTPVHLSCFTDITKRKRANDRLLFINELADDILSQPDADAAINRAIKRLMTYFEADRCYIVEIDTKKHVSNNTYEVCAEGVPSEIRRLQNIPFTEDDFWYKSLSTHNSYILNDIEELADDDMKELLKSQGIRSMMLVPLWRDNRLTGFVGVDNPASVSETVARFSAPTDYLSVLLTRRDIKRAVGHDITPDDGMNPAAAYISDMLPVVFSTMMETSGDISFIKDRAGRYAAVSAAAIKTFGLASADEIIGKTAQEVFPKVNIMRFSSEDDQVFETGKSIINREMTLPLSTGDKAVFHTSKYPLRDAAGEIIGIYCVCRDVTNEKVTEFELNTLLRVIPSGVLKYSADDKAEFAYVNQNLIESLGYTKAEFMKKFKNSFREMVWWEDRERADYEILTQEGNGGIGKFDYRIEASDGQLRWYHDEGVKITDDRGKEWYYVILIDITNTKLNEANLRQAEEEYRLATRHSGHTIGRYDIKTKTLTITEDAATRLALPETIPDVPYGRVRLGKISADTADAYISLYENIINGKREGTATFKKLLKDGWHWINERATTIFDDNGKPVSAIISYSDVTEQQEKELVYKRWQQSMEGKDPSTYTVFRFNLSKNTPPDSWEGTLLNQEIAKAFDARTRKYADMFVHENDREKYTTFVNTDTMLAEYYRGRRFDSMEYREISPGGGMRWLKLSTDLVEAPSSSDIEAYLLYENIDERKRAELEAKHMAETDPLTGLLNRKEFAQRVNNIIEKSGEKTGHLFLMIDVDEFKKLNDTFGHAEGDQALIHTAKALSSVLRKDDLLGRLGGDEFVMFLSNVSEDINIRKKAEQICKSVEKTYQQGMQLTVSIGVCQCPKDGSDCHTLYEKSDEALYKAKKAGRNTYKIYEKPES